MPLSIYSIYLNESKNLRHTLITLGTFIKAQIMSIQVLNHFRAQSFEVSLPADLKCIDCSIRLVRQAAEWSKKYKFWSCADVDILPQKESFLNICSGHGKSYSGRCRCDPLSYGHQCQYRDECRTDKDCGIHGKCQEVQAQAPKKQCFCQVGWFGPGCRKQNPKVLSKKRFSEGLYTKQEVSDKMTVYWRILHEIQEIEVVMKSKTTSWHCCGSKSFWAMISQSADSALGLNSQSRKFACKDSQSQCCIYFRLKF